MGRKKQITDEELIAQIDKYYLEVCEGHVDMLKVPEIGGFLRRTGYPELKDYIIRRNASAIAYINNLKQAQKGEILYRVATYKTIDADEFIEKNHSISSMKKALSELSMYYKSVCDAATQINEQYKNLEKNVYSKEREQKYTKDKLEKTEKKLTELKEQLKQLQANNKILRTVVETYVYPEIANELLQRSGFIKETQGIISDSTVELEIINAETQVKSKSNVVQGMFDRYKE